MKIKIMTFNIRCAVKGDGINYFPNRTDRIRRMLAEEQPDLIGFQEASDVHRSFLRDVLSDRYVVLGCGRERNYRGESTCIAYRRDLFELIALETFALSSTPDIPGSVYEGSDQSSCPRICTHATLSCNGIATPIHFFNTHLDHKGVQARILGMMQILQQVSSCRGQVILTGDMNARPDELTVRLPLSMKNKPLADATAEVLHTFHGYGRVEDCKIDYIFTDGKPERAYAVKDAPIEGVYYSDHYAVCSFVELDEA